LLLASFQSGLLFLSRILKEDFKREG